MVGRERDQLLTSTSAAIRSPAAPRSINVLKAESISRSLLCITPQASGRRLRTSRSRAHPIYDRFEVEGRALLCPTRAGARAPKRFSGGPRRSWPIQSKEHWVLNG
jgi:hypothetical protein